jgi:hypothetical protein
LRDSLLLPSAPLQTRLSAGRRDDLNSPIVLQSAPASPQTNAAIPAEDLKPLYDFTIECKACQAKLAAAQGDLTDERQKPPHSHANATTLCASLEAEASGAAAGAVAAKTAH